MVMRAIYHSLQTPNWADGTDCPLSCNEQQLLGT
jgi:hypothetical protein